MITITQLTDTLNTTIDEANTDIETLNRCNERMANSIEENQHLISWNRGRVDHAEFTLEEIEKGQKTVVREHIIDENDLITELEQYQTYLCRMNGYSDYGGHFSKEKYGKLKGTLVEMICMWRFDDDNKRYHGKYAMYPANESDQKMLWQDAIIWMPSDILDVIKVTRRTDNPADARIELLIHHSEEFDRYRADKDAIINRQRASIHGYGIRVDELVDGINEQHATIDKLRDENGYLRNRLRAIRAMPADDQDIRIRLASALHDLTTHWMKVAIKHPDIGRDFLDKPFDELVPIDKYAVLRDADTILDAIRGE